MSFTQVVRNTVKYFRAFLANSGLLVITGSPEYSTGISVLDDDTLPLSREDNARALCLANADNQEFDCSMNETIEVSGIQQQFLYAAEKCMESIDLITGQERVLLIEIKEALPRETRRALSIVKHSMQVMHAVFAKELDTNLNEVTAVLTRVEHVHEEIQDFKQWGKEPCENESMTHDTHRDLLERKEMIETMIEDTISKLNQKRQRDEQLFSEFSENIKRQVQQSIEILERCLQKSAVRRKNQMNAKVSELKGVLQELKKFG